MHLRCIMTPLQPQSSQPRRTRCRNSHTEAHLGLLDSETISWLLNYGKQSDRCSALGTFVVPICLIYLQRFRLSSRGDGRDCSGWPVSLQLLSREHSTGLCFYCTAATQIFQNTRNSAPYCTKNQDFWCQ